MILLLQRLFSEHKKIKNVLGQVSERPLHVCVGICRPGSPVPGHGVVLPVVRVFLVTATVDARRRRSRRLFLLWPPPHAEPVDFGVDQVCCVVTLGCCAWDLLQATCLQEAGVVFGVQVEVALLLYRRLGRRRRLLGSWRTAPVRFRSSSVAAAALRISSYG